MKKFFTLIAAMVASSSMMAQDVEWSNNLFTNSDVEGADLSGFAVKNSTPGGVQADVILTDSTLTAAEGKGVNGSKAIEVISYARTNVDSDHDNAWQAQLWIVLPKKSDGSTLEVGEKFKVSFDYRAESDYFTSEDAAIDADGKVSFTVDTQAHGAPGNYHYWSCIGSPSVTSEWQVYEAEATVAGDWIGKDGFQTIAFNLSAVKDFDVKFYFDNIKVYYEKEDQTLVKYWKPVVTNGDFEGDNTTNYIVRISGAGGDQNATPVEGIGYEETRGIEITVPAKASETWDSQFFIYMNEAIPSGDMIKVEFDYKASEDMGSTIDTQSHGATAGSYNHYTAIGSITFKTEWQHYSYVQSVSTDQSKEDNQYQNIAFNLAVSDHPVTLYLDNITVKHQVLVPAGENPAKIALDEYMQNMEGKYNMSNLSADKSNEAVRNTFSEVYSECQSLGDEDDYEAALDKLTAAEGKYSASVKDYKNLNNFITLINEKAEQAGKMGDDFAGLKEALEAKAEPLIAQYDAEQWTREEINAAIDNKSVYDMVAEAVKPNIKEGLDVTILMNNSNFAWGSSSWNGGVTVNYGVAERYHTSFDVNQTLSEMPKGSYTIKLNGFQRIDEDGEMSALLYANDAAKYLVNRDEAEDGYTIDTEDGVAAPNSMQQAADAFAEGAYANELTAVLTEAGDLKIGVKGTNGNIWVIWDNFQVVYQGVSMNAMASAIKDQIGRAEDVETALEESLNEPTINKCLDLVTDANNMVEKIAETSEADANKMIDDLIAVVAEMQEVSKLLTSVRGAYTDFTNSYDEFYEDAIEDVKVRAKKVYDSYENEDFIKLETAGVKEFLAEAQYLTGALKISKAALAATDENPFDLTYLFVNPDFEDYAEVGQNKNYPGWSGSGFGTGGGTAGPVAERWNQSNGFDTYVDFVGLPEGTYTLECDGAYRVGGSVGDADYNAAKDGTTDQATFLYATTSEGTNKAAMFSIYTGKMTADEIAAYLNEDGEPIINTSSNCETYTEKVVTGQDEEGNDIIESTTYYFPNQLFTADQWMDVAGKFKGNKVTFKVGKDGKARVGISRGAGQGNNWAFADNFKLNYFGANSSMVPTAVEAIETVKAAEAIYTISGVRVNKAAKPGLYIINGKKVAVK